MRLCASCQRRHARHWPQLFLFDSCRRHVFQALLKTGSRAQKRKPDMNRPWRIPLLFQEQIKGPKNDPIARFDRFRRYQTNSENALAFEARTAAKKQLAAKL